MARFIRLNGILAKVEKYNRFATSSHRIYLTTQHDWFIGGDYTKKLPQDTMLTSFDREQAREENILFRNETICIRMNFEIIDPSTIFEDDITKDIVGQSLYILESQLKWSQTPSLGLKLMSEKATKSKYPVKMVTISEDTSIYGILELPLLIFRIFMGIMAATIQISFMIFIILVITGGI